MAITNIKINITISTLYVICSFVLSIEGTLLGNFILYNIINIPIIITTIINENKYNTLFVLKNGNIL
jgi:hypothetical protein